MEEALHKAFPHFPVQPWWSLLFELPSLLQQSFIPDFAAISLEQEFLELFPQANVLAGIKSAPIKTINIKWIFFIFL